MILETSLPKIVLRPLALADVKPLSLIADNRKIWLNVRDRFPHPYTEQNAIDFIVMVEQSSKDFVFGIEFETQLVGMVGLHGQTDIYQHSVELGYFIAEPFWNKGIAGCAVKAVVQYGFETLHLHRIYAMVFQNNIASMRVLEKCGFEQEGIRKQAVFKDGQFLDEYCFGQLNNLKTKNR